MSAADNQWSIRSKLTLFVTVLIGFIATFIYLYFPDLYERQGLDAQMAKGRAIALMTAYSISPAVFFEDLPAIQEVSYSALQNRDLLYLVVKDYHGKTLFSIDKAGRMTACCKQFAPDSLLWKERILQLKTPILQKNQMVGQLWLGLGLDGVFEATERAKQNIAMLSAMIFLMGVLAILVSSKVIIDPLDRMIHTVAEISAGKLDSRAPDFAGKEVAALSSAFNQMLDRIAQAHKELKAINNELESRVEKRTLELRQEIVERQKAEEFIQLSLLEKEVLLKEIHHRVKNNMQVITSLLNLQSRTLEDPKVRSLFVESQNRVRSMALIHEKLYQSHDLAKISFYDYLQDLVSHLNTSFNNPNISTTIHTTDIKLNIDQAIPCGLIVNELICNALKYAFPGNQTGSIEIQMNTHENRRVELVVQDNGIGLPEGFDPEMSKSLGYQLVLALTRQIHGRLQVVSEHGTQVHIHFEVV